MSAAALEHAPRELDILRAVFEHIRVRGQPGRCLHGTLQTKTPTTSGKGFCAAWRTLCFCTPGSSTHWS
jgi:hypothetical protein